MYGVPRRVFGGARAARFGAAQCLLRFGRARACGLHVRTTMAIFVAAAACMAGCTSPASTSGAASSMAAEQSAAPTPHPMGREHGLAVRRMRVADDAALMAGALARYADTSPLSKELTERLDRSGLRVVLVPLTDLERVLSELGGVSIDRTVWHGQATTWRPLVERTISGQDVVGIEGRLRTFEAGTMRFLLRGWTLMMEDGVHLYVELLPDFDQTRSNEMDRLFARPQFEGERFLSLHTELLLDPDHACLITVEQPGATWKVAESDAAGAVRSERDRGEGAAEDGDAPDRAREPARGGVPMTGAGPGPDYLPPRTLGEVLFRAEGRLRGREVVVVMPRMAPDAGSIVRAPAAGSADAASAPAAPRSERGSVQ